MINKYMIKYFLIALLLLIYCDFVFAKDLNNIVIPQDANLRPYSAIVGRDEQGRWQPLSLKNLGNERYGLEIGSISAQIMGSISTVVNIDKPIWEAQPQLTNVTFTAEIPAYGSYTHRETWDFVVTEYGNYLEYIVIVRDEIYSPDNYSFEFHTKQTGNQLFLGGEVAPASGQSIFIPPIPIAVFGGVNDGYRLIIWNKSPYSQRMKVGLVFSWRKN